MPKLEKGLGLVMYQDRWYQREAVDSTIRILEEKPTAHPLIVAPTGSGKSHILCLFIDDYITKNPSDDILIVSHVAEILEQDHAAIENYFNIEVGLYSKGLDSRTIRKITVAGIQSVYNKPKLFAHFKIVIIDEAHRIPTSGNGMYRKFLGALNATYIGLTATHFRLGHGYIHEGEGALFTDIAYDISEFEAFNRLVEEGYLSRLITKRTIEKLDTDGIKKTAGDFNTKEMVERFDRNAITEAAVDEIIKFGKNFKKWLIFAIEIEHAEHIANELRSHGINTACIHSKMCNRHEEMLKIKSGLYRAVVNVDILTTGFDDPCIDLIALLRPTDSPSLHVQMIGRGLRVVLGDEGNGFDKFGNDLSTIEGRLEAIQRGPKQACLVLDFAGNTDRLGPINDVKVKQKGKLHTDGEAIVKTCPDCGVIQHPSVKICDVCGHEFIFKEKISAVASSANIVKNEKILKEWLPVKSVSYSIHQKAGSPSSLRVSYNTGFISFSEWVCYDHTGFPKRKANHWVRWRWRGQQDAIPYDLTDLYKSTDMLLKPVEILVNNTGKFPSIEDYKF